MRDNAAVISRIGVISAGCLAAVATLWPMWTPAPVLAVLNGVAGVLFLLTGVLLGGGNGRLLGLAGVAWLGIWLEAYRTPVLDLAGGLCGALFLGAMSALLLRYPDERLSGRFPRVFVGVAATWSLAGALILGAGVPARPVLNLGAALLAVIFCVLLGRRLAGARGLHRLDLMPVTVAAIGAAATLGIRLVGSLLSPAPPLRVAEAAVFLVLPGGFLVAAMQRRIARAAVAEAELTERRRLERDLHDGAQQLLLGLSMRLGTLRAAGAGQPWQETVDQARSDLRAAQRELRELAHGLHPALLTVAGLGPALEAVVERMPLPVRLEVPDRRWDGQVEAVAYFIAAEALTNVAKHAGATEVTVTVVDDPGSLCLTVTDDGAGGAVPGPGLRDRAHAVGGTFAVSSPPGAGTTISVSLPCG